MTTLAQQAAVAGDPGFQERIRAAVISAAINILSGGPGTMDIPVFSARNRLAAAVLENITPYLTAFAIAVSVNPVVAADLGSPVPVTSISGGFPASLVTAVAHGLATGDTVRIAGTSDAAVNGTWAVTVTDTVTFTVPAPGTGFTTGSGGTVTKQALDADITSAVAGVWNAMAGVNSRT